MKLTPRLTFDGKSEEAMNYYSKIFNGKIISLVRFSEAGEECCDMSGLNPDEKKRIMNATLQLGSDFISSCDQFPGQAPQKGNNVMLDISIAGEMEVKGVFGELAENGTIVVPLAPAAWTPSYGLIIDRYGIYWNIMQKL